MAWVHCHWHTLVWQQSETELTAAYSTIKQGLNMGLSYMHHQVLLTTSKLTTLCDMGHVSEWGIYRVCKALSVIGKAVRLHTGWV